MHKTTAKHRALLALAGSLFLAGCQAATDEPASAPQAGATTDAAEAPDGVPAQGRSGRGSASLTIGNSEPLTAEVTCVLEPEGEILFYATSTSTTEPNFAVQVMAADAPRAEADFVDLATGETWYGGPDVVAMLDGNVISGTGTFSKEGDGADEQPGTFSVTCPD